MKRTRTKTPKLKPKPKTSEPGFELGAVLGGMFIGATIGTSMLADVYNRIPEVAVERRRIEAALNELRNGLRTGAHEAAIHRAIDLLLGEQPARTLTPLRSL